MENKQETVEKHYYARKFALLGIIAFVILLFISFFLLEDVTLIVSICILNIVIQLVRYYTVIVVIGHDYIKIRGGIIVGSKYILFNEIVSWDEDRKKIEIYYRPVGSEEEEKGVIYTNSMEENEKESLLEELNKICPN